MSPPKIHGFIQIWSKRTGATEWKEALIETRGGEEEVKLAVTFKSGECARTFHLTNNIANVVLEHRGEKQSRLHLTFRNKTSLFIARLPCIDAEEWKNFLVRFQNPMNPDSGWYALENSNTQGATSKTLLHDVCDKFGSFNTQNGGGTPSPRKVPPLKSKSPALVKKGTLGEKRKRSLSSGLEMSEDVLREESPVPKKKCRTQTWKRAGRSREKPASLEEAEEDGGSEAGPSPKASSATGPGLDEAVLPTQPVSDKTGLAFPVESEPRQHDPRQQEAQVAPGTVPEQRRGFPNLGNTCYMNAVLQSLFAIPSFAEGLLMQGVPWERIPLDALMTPMSLLLVLKDVCKVETKEELLASVKSAISAVAEVFSGNKQNDAHEFLFQCLHQLKDEIENLNTTWNTERHAGGENSSPQVYPSDTDPKAFVCPVVANFEFEMQISIICKGCGWVVLKTEPNNHLSINLHQEAGPLPLSLQNVFDLFFRAEELEYSCEKCEHPSSVLRCQFSSLPRVLVVHLKRYSFNDAWMLVKNDQQVAISKYLILSSQCSESTKPPLPLDGNAPAGDTKVLKVIPQEMISKILGPSTPSVKLSSESCDSLVPHFRPGTEAEPLESQRVCEGARQKPPSGLENGAELEPELVNPGDRRSEQKQPTAHSAADEPREDQGQPVGNPASALAEVPEEPENPELQNYEKSDTWGTQGHPEQSLSRPTEARLQRAGRGVCGVLGSDEHPGDQHTTESAVAEVHGPDPKELQGPRQAYRLVSVVSHEGSSRNSGHYISDAYDFQKQAWFTYDDLRVWEIPEAVMQEARTHTGYIFFYMHSEIFEALLEKAVRSQELSAHEEVMPWDDVENGFFGRPV